MKVFGIVGWKNSGKTTLTEKVVASMVSKGYSVSSLKHAHHNFVVDQEGKDSDRHKKAGASQVIVTSKNQWALISSQRYSEKEVLSKMLKKLDPVDFVIIEGFKTYWHPKIETYLSGNSHEPLIATSKNIIGLVHDLDYFEGEQEHFRFEEIEKIVNFVICNAVEIDQLVNDVK